MLGSERFSKAADLCGGIMKFVADDSFLTMTLEALVIGMAQSR